MRRLNTLFSIGITALCIQSCASNDVAVAKPPEPAAAQTPPVKAITLSGELALFGNEPFAWLGIRQVQGLDAPLVKLVFVNRTDLLHWRNFQNKRVTVQGVLLAPELNTPQVQVHSMSVQP
jgi:hypothetical protein